MKVVKVVVGRSQPKAISTREATDGLPNVEDETDSLQPSSIELRIGTSRCESKENGVGCHRFVTHGQQNRSKKTKSPSFLHSDAYLRDVCLVKYSLDSCCKSKECQSIQTG